jgi:hypothetical protein
MRWWSVSSFSIEIEYTGALSVSIDKNIEDWGRANLEAALRKLLAYLCLCEGCVGEGFNGSRKVQKEKFVSAALAWQKKRKKIFK